jgi:hypothetical protein
MPKNVGDVMSTIHCLKHPWALVGFFHQFIENARYNDQHTVMFAFQRCYRVVINDYLCFNIVVITLLTYKRKYCQIQLHHVDEPNFPTAR